MTHAVLALAFLSGFMSFALNWGHTLSTLIALEFMTVALFSLLTLLSLLSPGLSYNAMFYISMAVCEGALGLSVVVSFARKKGNEMLPSATTYQW